jgi:nicotinamide-nucleotide amidase
MLVIGDELLDGRVTDTNSVKIAARLAEQGVSLAQRTTVTDDVDVIVRAARAAMARGTELCLVSGGLGPTSDDVTAEAFAAMAGVPLERDETQVAVIEERLRARGRTLTANQKKQADRPAGSELIANPRGTAPGFALDVEGCRFVAMPGVPHELEHMAEVAVFDRMAPAAERFVTRALYTFGYVEAEVDARLAPVRDAFGAVRFGFRAHFPEIHVTLKAPAPAAASLDSALAAARSALGDAVFAEEQHPFAAVVLEALRRRGATLATAESCTGGLIGDRLTNVPGSSDVYLGGVVAYANACKVSALGVQEATLEKHGAVSEPTVLEMAHGVRERLGANFAVSSSGIAGPDGGTPDRPVGTVWIAVVGDALEETRLLHLPFERRGNKVVSTYAALDLLRRRLS